MAIRERQKALVRLFWRRFSILLVSALIIFAGLAVWGVFQKERESKELRTQAEVQVSDLREQDQNLSERIGDLQTERGKEGVLREQYGVAKQGEGMIVIIRAENRTTVEATSTMKTWVRKFVPFW